MANDVVIHVKATDDASGKLDSIGKKAGDLGSKLSGALKAGALAGGAALAGLGVASIKMAKDFENSFAEVATLLPNLDKGGIAKLRQQTVDFSKEMGIATDKVVPALYQAISAGVPADNAIDFMRTASKAAIGGVTSLETAVDGITSVVNAYGAEALSAGRASDIMFTAVKLGKTDFEQLSRSLFNVVPTAASLGIGLEEIAASLAVMTAQGVPTSVATTQLRQAFVEVSKSGTELDKAIKELTDESFADLVDSGKSGVEIFQMLRESMPDQDFKDLFGSVEAMNAALSLTGPNAAKVDAAMKEMAGSAGATDKAFSTIAETASFKFSKAINLLKVELMEVGLKALPHLTKALETVTPWLEKNIPVAIEGIKKVIDDLKPAVKELADGFVTGMETIMPLLEGFWGFLRDHKELMIAALVAIGVAVVLAFGPASAAVLAIMGIITAIGLLKKHWDEIKDYFNQTWPEFATAASMLLAGPFALVLLGMSTNAFGMRDKVGEALDSVVGFFESLPGRVLAAIGDVASWLSGIPRDFYNAGWDAIEALIRGLGSRIGELRGWIKRNIIDTINPLNWDIPGLSPFEQAFEHAGQIAMDQFAGGMEQKQSALLATLHLVNQNILNGIGDPTAWTQLKIGLLQQLDEVTKAIAGKLQQMGPEILDGIDNDLDGAIDEGLSHIVETIKQASVEILNGIDDDLDGAIDEGLSDVVDTIRTISAEIKDGIDNDLDGMIDEGLSDVVDTIRTISAEIKDGIDNDLDGMIDEGLDDVAITVGAGMDAIIAAAEQKRSGLLSVMHLIQQNILQGIGDATEWNRMLLGLLRQLEETNRTIAGLPPLPSGSGSTPPAATTPPPAPVRITQNAATLLRGSLSNFPGVPSAGFFEDALSGRGNIAPLVAWFNSAAGQAMQNAPQLLTAIGRASTAAGSDLLTLLRNAGLSFARGGIVPGPIGAPQLAVVHGGETITPAGGGGVVINNYVTAWDSRDVERWFETNADRMASAVERSRGRRMR